MKTLFQSPIRESFARYILQQFNTPEEAQNAADAINNRAAEELENSKSTASQLLNLDVHMRSLKNTTGGTISVKAGANPNFLVSGGYKTPDGIGRNKTVNAGVTGMFGSFGGDNIYGIGGNVEKTLNNPNLSVHGGIDLTKTQNVALGGYVGAQFDDQDRLKLGVNMRAGGISERGSYVTGGASGELKFSDKLSVSGNFDIGASMKSVTKASAKEKQYLEGNILETPINDPRIPVEKRYVTTPNQDAGTQVIWNAGAGAKYKIKDGITGTLDASIGSHGGNANLGIQMKIPNSSKKGKKWKSPF